MILALGALALPVVTYARPPDPPEASRDPERPIIDAEMLVHSERGQTIPAERVQEALQPIFGGSHTVRRGITPMLRGETGLCWVVWQVNVLRPHAGGQFRRAFGLDNTRERESLELVPKRSAFEQVKWQGQVARVSPLPAYIVPLELLPIIRALDPELVFALDGLDVGRQMGWFPAQNGTAVLSAVEIPADKLLWMESAEFTLIATWMQQVIREETDGHPNSLGREALPVKLAQRLGQWRARMGHAFGDDAALRFGAAPERRDIGQLPDESALKHWVREFNRRLEIALGRQAKEIRLGETLQGVDEDAALARAIDEGQNSFKRALESANSVLARAPQDWIARPAETQRAVPETAPERIRELYYYGYLGVRDGPVDADFTTLARVLTHEMRQRSRELEAEIQQSPEFYASWYRAFYGHPRNEITAALNAAQREMRSARLSFDSLSQNPTGRARVITALEQALRDRHSEPALAAEKLVEWLVRFAREP